MMKISKVVEFVLISTVFATLGMYGCGGGGSVSTEDTVPEGYTRISIRGSAGTRSAAMDSFGGLLTISDPFKDVGGEAGGSGTDGPDSIADTAASTCLFSGPVDCFEAGVNISINGDLEIYVSNGATSALCTDENNCIYCDVDASAQASCAISCDGMVASNSISAADSFKVVLTAYHAFTTEMSSPTGMIRVDGNAASLDSETLIAANIDSESGLAPRTFSMCVNGGTGPEGSDKVTVSDVEGSGMTLNTQASSIWHVGHEVTVLDVSVGEDSPGACHIEDKLTIVVSLTGADTPDASLDMAFSEIGMSATICDSEDVCNEYNP